LTFEAFLKKLLRHRPRHLRMILVLDNATYHHAVLLRPLLKAYRRNLTLLYLPPYTPAALADRARLEARSAPGDAQPVLRHAQRAPRSGHRALRMLETSQSGTATAMRHYLRRCV